MDFHIRKWLDRLIMQQCVSTDKRMKLKKVNTRFNLKGRLSKKTVNIQPLYFFHYSNLTLGFYIYILGNVRSEEHTSELQSRFDLVCRLLLEKKNNAQCYKVSCMSCHRSY